MEELPGILSIATFINALCLQLNGDEKLATEIDVIIYPVKEGSGDIMIL